MLSTKVKETIKRYRMLNPGDRVVVAVSGGPDSVCLLSVLQACAEEFSITLHVAHLNHMFRGAESAREALFVEKLAKKLGISATIEQFEVSAYCRERGLSAQAGARDVRYRFLHQVADKVGASRIATGHTATDQAETFLMRLLRGAGVSGLSAIRPVRQNVVRPLIDVTREEVLNYLRTTGLEYVSDPSNSKPVYTRNKIRLEILPIFKQFNPRIVETLASEAALLRDEEDAAESCLSIIAEGVMIQEGDIVSLKREDFNALPRAFKRRILRRAVALLGVRSSDLSSVQINDAIAFMAAAQTGRVMHLPYGLLIEREYSKFVIRLQASAETYSYTIMVPGITAIPELGLEVETSIHEANEEGNPHSYKPVVTGEGEVFEASLPANKFWKAQFDYDKIGSRLTIRNRRSGDWFCPSGMGGKSKKLQDFFVDEKIPGQRRNRIPILLSGENIVWVVGMRTDNRFLPRENTKSIVGVHVRNKRAKTHCSENETIT